MSFSLKKGYSKFFKIVLFLLVISCIHLRSLFAQILEFETAISIKGSELHQSIRFLKRIDQENKKFLNVAVFNTQKGDKFKLRKAVIMDVDGNVLKKFSEKDLVTRSDYSQGTFYSDFYVKTLDFAWNTESYFIEYEYTQVQSEFFHITHWFPQPYKAVGTLSARLSFEADNDYAFNEKVQGDFQKEVEKISDKRTKTIWSVQNLTYAETEAFSPPISTLLPNIELTPVNFHYGEKGSYEDWNAFARWNYQLIEGLDELTASEKQKVDDLLYGITDEREKVERLYTYLQDHVTYVNVAIDIGGMKPYPASFVCDTKYGDCKALTIYMKALLKHAGIASTYALIYGDQNNVPIDLSYPSQQFNHVVLMVPIEGDSLWLENTSNTLPLNYHGTFTQNRYALLVSEEGGEFVKTKALTTDEVRCERRLTYTVDQTGSGLLKTNMQLRGREFEIAINYLDASQNERKKMLEGISKIDFGSLTQARISYPNRNDSVLSVEINSVLANRFRKLGNRYVISLTDFLVPSFEKPALRRTEAWVPYPINEQIEERFIIKGSNQMDIKLPESIIFENVAGRYQLQSSINEDTLTIYKEFVIKPAKYLKDGAYNELYTLIDTINKGNKTSIILKP
jgi:hypothetical protein